MKIFPSDIETILGGLAPMATGGAYEGASRIDRDLAMYNPPFRSADMDVLTSKHNLDNRVRDMARNDAYVQGGVNLHQDNIVGAAFMLNAKPSTLLLGLDETWATEFQQEVEAKFTAYSESPNNWLDASRMNPFTEQVRLAVGLSVISGEVLASVEWIRDPSRPFNTAIQMIDTDRLSNPNDEWDNQFLRGGVVKDRYGAPQSYWIRLAHPVDFINDNSMYTWKNVPIRKPWGRLQMIHIMEQFRPDQSRGVAAMAAALKEMRITKKFRDITLQSAVVNATYAASIESDLPADVVMQAMGGGTINPSAITDYAASYLGAIAEFTASAKNNHIDGVKIPHFFPGTKLQVRNVGTPGGIGTGFEESLLRYVAANLGVSYEELSRDYTRTNYSSARAAMNNTWKHMQVRKKIVADKFASMIYRLWLEEAINSNEITSLPRKAPNWYDGLNAEAYTMCDWIGASRGQIDELKETQAAVLRIKYNLSTYEDEMGRLGKDWRIVYAQRKREQDLAKRYELVMPTDAPAQGTATDAGSSAAKDTPQRPSASHDIDPVEFAQEDEEEEVHA